MHEVIEMNLFLHGMFHMVIRAKVSLSNVSQAVFLWLPVVRDPLFSVR